MYREKKLGKLKTRHWDWALKISFELGEQKKEHIYMVATLHESQLLGTAIALFPW